MKSHNFAEAKISWNQNTSINKWLELYGAHMFEYFTFLLIESGETEESDCPEDWIGDLICDDECNISEHNFDDGDCCMSEDTGEWYNCVVCECILPPK